MGVLNLRRDPAWPRRGVAGLLGLLLWTGAAPGWADEARVYRFSPVNQYGISLTAAYWNPIMEYVSEKSGVQLQLKIGRTSADTTAYVLAREVDFVFSNHLFSPEREKLGWRVFGRRQTPAVRGQIVVPADSPLRDDRQLEGRDVVYPGPEALVAYKFPAAHLSTAGIHVNTVFSGNSDAAFAQLFSGKAAAAGANSQLAEGYARREGKQLRVLWSSPPLYDLALMASSGVPDRTLQAVAQAFLGMGQDPQGREVLRKASAQVGLGPDAVFVPSDGSEYRSYRDFYRNAPPALR